MAYASVIGASAVIRGNVRGEGSLEVLGRVEGDVVVTGDLAIGPEGVVVGAVSGARVEVSGSVEGDITGSDSILIAETGRVVGDLNAPRIGMGEGAHLRGAVRAEGGPRPVSSARSSDSRPSSETRASEPRPAESRSSDVRPLTLTPVDRAVARASGNNGSPAVSSARKAPPPPVIKGPRPGARARKKLARR